MEGEDMISLPASSPSTTDNEELCKFDIGENGADLQPSDNDVANAHNSVINGDSTRTEQYPKDGENLRLKEDNVGNEKGTKGPENLVLHEGGTGTNEGTTALENLGLHVDDTAIQEGAASRANALPNEGDSEAEEGQHPYDQVVEMDLVDSPIRQVNIEVVQTVTVAENLNSFGFMVNAENGFLNTQNGSPIHCGVKRARLTYNGQNSSVHVTYNSLTRASKRKLEELLQQWSEWHTQHGSSSEDNELLESGEETYFPALRVGTDRSSAVSFWIESQTRKQQSNNSMALDGESVPIYDRGYVLGLTSADGPSNIEGGLEVVDDAARCFNCGSYNHSLKECPKPRDNVAVNNARKQYKSKRNQSNSTRNPVRYYQNSSGGKYDGLRPGSLHAETRKLLGLRELDPPPWLNRMRELGYPPGYLDVDDEDQPSGIIIFADDNNNVKEEQEDGEITEMEYPETQRKMTVDFPGINAPIPENADERLWASGTSDSDSSRNWSHHGLSHSSKSISRWHFHEQRWSSDFMDDGPPGVDSVTIPSMFSYPPRYGYGYDSPRDPSPTRVMSHSDRGRSPVVYEDFVSHSSFRSPPYSSKRTPQDYGSGRSEYKNEHYSLDYTFRNINDDDRYDPHKRRRKTTW